MSADVLRFDTSSLNIAEEAAIDHDVILHQELKQLIAEQFEDFDFGDDLDDEYKSNNSDVIVAQQHTAKSNPEDLTSILAAGKLSLLENAIQRFGEEETRMSGEIETEHSGSESLSDRNGSPSVSNSEAPKMPLTQTAVQSDLLCMIRSDNCALVRNNVCINPNNVRDEAYCSVSTFGQTETPINCTVGHLRDAPPNERGSSTASVVVQR
ncbi:hypothetical protein PHET_11403 [Paragonimus heterotremus]|uniref:Uncharacterized protein n=1 Tax=Paragonimus heterotremus TaxID=100268 RepID=A0A8J4WMD5_9TREM|nr:hypothetical protein PHET_11403 [Paragonimus heterotremus]